MKHIAISISFAGPILAALSAAAAAQVGLAPVTPLLPTQLPGIAPSALPSPIERPGWPKIEIYVAPTLSPVLPQTPAIQTPAVRLPSANPARPLSDDSARPWTGDADIALPAVQTVQAVPVAVHAVPVSGRGTQARRPATQNLHETRQAFRMDGPGRAAQPSAENLRAVFDGLQKAQGAGVVDTRPSDADDEVEGSPVEEQPLPWLEPSRPVTLPEWDLEKEIGLR